MEPASPQERDTATRDTLIISAFMATLVLLAAVVLGLR